jgi:predicted Zn-dependent protease
MRAEEHRLERMRWGYPAAAGKALALALSLFVASCASITPEVPEAPATPAALPASVPRTTGADTPTQREHKRLVEVFGGEYHAPAAEKLLNEVLAKLAPASDVPGEAYKVTLLNSPVVNAFALPSGNIYVTRGLLALADDTAEVAAVMAHEIGHVTAHHAAQRAELEQRSFLIGRVVSKVLDKPDEGKEVAARLQLSLASFSRQQELDADRIGIRVIARAGYDPYAASRFLQLLGRSVSLRASLLGQRPNGDQVDILSTHPSTPERVAAALAQACQIGAPGIGDAGRDAYLAAIQGIAYGDDPAEGFIRGTLFLHPKLGFAFTAPDGFVLENSAQAVLGIAAGGTEALRLDRVDVASTMTLETYLASGWIEGLKQSSIESLTIGGLQAATAIARGTEWTFRLTAIRFGPDVYRMIFATRNLTEDVDKQFRASMQGFHRMSQDEASAARPLRIEIVTAGPADTAERLAAKMPVPERPVDTFLLLNGLEHPGDVKPGERYKIVAD